ncbi:MAG TPA: ATP-binding protein [Gammaproteobacteria bacterium]|jgi:two-component system sensor histidine kinase GlrK|nr:ATP-binding protein [Gammaproteobacteria bacterium]
MKFFRPKSILRLILTGFALVALPLIVALLITTVSVDRLVTQGQSALMQSVLVTQGSQSLVEAIKAMERNARQYQVLGEKVLYDVYVENHSRFLDTARSLETLEISATQQTQLKELRVVEDEVYTVLATYPYDAKEVADALPQFIDLGLIAQGILVDSQQLIASGVERMQRQSGKVKKTLLIQAAALVPAVLLLTIIFVFLISRPIRQIDRAIHRLGAGEFTEPSNISGPRDLVQLGDRLDWLRDRLLELEQDKTRFLQHMSHELKTPLTAIREGADLLREKIVGDLNSQQEEIAGILHENSLQLQKLIEDLLNFSILQSRSAELVRGPVDLQPLIEEVIETHKLAIMARHLQLETIFRPVSLSGDRDKLRTLLDNLVSNAIKYSPDSSRLRISLSTDRAYACIDVADSGPGIPEEEHERVFEAFYQGKPAARGPVRGTGLGLSIAREYARAHGGDVSVVKSDQTGATLRVVLPMEL